MKQKAIIILVMLITIAVICIISTKIYTNEKVNKANKFINTIDRIEFANYTLDKETIKNNLKYDRIGKDITKGEYDGVLYYSNGNIEKIKLRRNSATTYLIKIKDINFILTVDDEGYYADDILEDKEDYTEQMKDAVESLSNWLEHPNELGKKPSKIECIDEFELDGLKYYIIRYKKNDSDKWLVGVAGGYEENSLETAGHIFSEFKEYKEEQAKEECIQMVNMLKNYWKDIAEEY